jgi:hypothetical protein
MALAIAALNASAATISGTDAAGLITMTSSSSAVTSICSARVTFNSAQAIYFPPLIQKVGYANGLTNPMSNYWYVGDTKTIAGFTVFMSNPDGIAPNSVFTFYYSVPNAT